MPNTPLPYKGDQAQSQKQIRKIQACASAVPANCRAFAMTSTWVRIGHWQVSVHCTDSRTGRKYTTIHWTYA